MTQEQTYSVKGMHCAACEVLIEKKLLDIPGVKAVDASLANQTATIEYEGEKPAISVLNNIFRKDNYTFFEGIARAINNERNALNPISFGFMIAIGIIAAFLLLDKLGISGLLNINSSSSLFAFFLFGLLAGLSSCAALVGGIVLSMSKQWQEIYNNQQSKYQKFQPHLLFNIGRIISYVLLGGVLGLIGSRIALSFQITAGLVFIISLLMIGLGLQMLGIKGFQRFQLSMPKLITRYIANESNFQARYMPFVMGAATFFLPCGFTIAAQTIALLSGSAIQGGLIMLAFALGTAPMLLLIGLSSIAFFSKPNLSLIFSRTAGFLVLFFALYNVYNQLLVLGIL